MAWLVYYDGTVGGKIWGKESDHRREHHKINSIEDLCNSYGTLRAQETYGLRDRGLLQVHLDFGSRRAGGLASSLHSRAVGVLLKLGEANGDVSGRSLHLRGVLASELAIDALPE